MAARYRPFTGCLGTSCQNLKPLTGNPEEKARASQYVIDTSRGMDATRAQVRALAETIRRG